MKARVFVTTPYEIVEASEMTCAVHTTQPVFRSKTHPNAKGVSSDRGYRLIKRQDHPRRNNYDYVREHILIAEAAIGKYLPDGAVVHHVNGIRNDNRNSNLVICENDQYHRLLHARQRVLDAGGDPNTDKICSACKALKPKTAFSRNRDFTDGLCGQCSACDYKRAKSRLRLKELATNPYVRCARCDRRVSRHAMDCPERIPARQCRACGVTFTPKHKYSPAKRTHKSIYCSRRCFLTRVRSAQ